MIIKSKRSGKTKKSDPKLNRDLNSGPDKVYLYYVTSRRTKRIQRCGFIDN